MFDRILFFCSGHIIVYIIGNTPYFSSGQITDRNKLISDVYVLHSCKKITVDTFCANQHILLILNGTGIIALNIRNETESLNQ